MPLTAALLGCLWFALLVLTLELGTDSFRGFSHDLPGYLLFLLLLAPASAFLAVSCRGCLRVDLSFSERWVAGLVLA
ncbi:MAG: hypothetical protein JNM84_05505, partial [Planctomycetes bacterium]|nr:hypothetical protein [Planctomycetota bacterium]